MLLVLLRLVMTDNVQGTPDTAVAGGDGVDIDLFAVVMLLVVAVLVVLLLVMLIVVRAVGGAAYFDSVMLLIVQVLHVVSFAFLNLLFYL